MSPCPWAFLLATLSIQGTSTCVHVSELFNVYTTRARWVSPIDGQTPAGIPMNPIPYFQLWAGIGQVPCLLHPAVISLIFHAHETIRFCQSGAPEVARSHSTPLGVSQWRLKWCLISVDQPVPRRAPGTARILWQLPQGHFDSSGI